MANWKYLSDEEKINHELYNKSSAFKWFLIYLIFQCFLAFGSAAGAYVDYSSSLRENYSHLNSLPSANSFLVMVMIPVLIMIIFLLLFRIYGKSKITVKLFVIFLIGYPIFNFIYSNIMLSIFNITSGEVIMKSLALIFLFIVYKSKEKTTHKFAK